jgi:site-specific recombinase XerD
MNFDELLTKYLGHLQIRNNSPRTVSDYGYNLGTFFAFLQQKAIADVQSITTATLLDFQRWFYYQPTKRGHARGVVNQNLVLATVKSF